MSVKSVVLKRIDCGIRGVCTARGGLHRDSDVSRILSSNRPMWVISVSRSSNGVTSAPSSTGDLGGVDGDEHERRGTVGVTIPPWHAGTVGKTTKNA